MLKALPKLMLESPRGRRKMYKKYKTNTGRQNLIQAETAQMMQRMITQMQRQHPDGYWVGDEFIVPCTAGQPHPLALLQFESNKGGSDGTR